MHTKPTRRTGAVVLCAIVLGGCVPAPAPDMADRFVLLDAAGLPQTAPDGAHDCVFDRMTALTWAVQRPGSELLDPAHTYSWYGTDSSRNAGEPGRRGGGSCGLARCDTEALLEAVNARGLCGAQDWRLPGHEEAITLGKSYDGSAVGLHPRLFPASVAGEFWTGSTYRLYPQSAWTLDAGTGLDRVDLKAEAKPVRLVRGAFAVAGQ